MASEKKAKKVSLKKPASEDHTSDLFETAPDNEWTRAEQEAKAEKEALDYEPAPETEMDFMTEEEEKTIKKNRLIGIILGALLAALLIGGFVYHNQHGKIRDTEVPTTTITTLLTTKPGAEAPEATTRSYVTRQLTVHKDQKGVWRSYAGLDPTVGYTGVVGNDTGWWYVENDVVNFKYNGIASNDYGDWLIENGKVNSKFSGKYIYNGRQYIIDGGKVVRSEKLTTTTTAATTKTTATTQSTTATTASTTASTTKHEHKWVAVYDGNAIVEDMNHFCKCPECGLNFKDRQLLESHAWAMNHKLSDDPANDAYNTGNEKQEVIIGYTNEQNTYWVCTLCGAETHNADDVDIGI